MDCKEFEKRIPDFISGEMNYLTIKAFREHMKSCAKCREELTIQFLINEGLVRLEEGAAFDLNSELRALVDEAEKKIRRHDRMLRVGIVWEYLAMLAAAAAVVWILGGNV